MVSDEEISAALRQLEEVSEAMAEIVSPPEDFTAVSETVTPMSVEDIIEDYSAWLTPDEVNVVTALASSEPPVPAVRGAYLDAAGYEVHVLSTPKILTPIDVFLERTKDILDDFYGENYGFLSDNAVHYLVIHFPEINITNSKGNKHVIKDIFVRFKLNRGWITGSIEGTRTTLTTTELTSRYTHSHLPGAAVHSWNGFCTGGNSAFGVALSDLALAQGDLDRFENFLFLLQGYLEWESLEGGPYNHMSTIGGDTNASDKNVDNGHIVAITSQLKVRYLKDLPFTAIKERNKTYIVPVESHFELAIKSILLESSQYKKLLCIKGSDGGYYLDGANNLAESVKSTFLDAKVPIWDKSKIKRELVPVKLEEDDSSKYPLPKLTKGCFNLIKTQLNEYYYKQ